MKTPFYKPLRLRAAFCVALWTCTAAQAAAPIITNITMVGTAPRFAVQSDLGITNQIQCCTNLSQTNWVALTNLLVTQSPYWFVDVAASPASERFYQVVALPTNGPGFTWIDQPMPHPDLMNGGTAVAFGNGLFSVVGYGPWWSDTSPDGVNYTYGPTDMRNYDWSGMTYGLGKYVVVAPGGAMYSSDGLHWTAGSGYPAGTVFADVAYGNGIFIASQNISQVAYSTDGVHWSTKTFAFGNFFWTRVTFGNGLFVAVSQGGGAGAAPGKVMISSDGINWTFPGCPNAMWSAVAYGNGLFVAAAGDGSGSVMYSPDATNWTLGSGPAVYAAQACYGGGIFVVVGGSNGMSLINTSKDGIHWTQQVSDASPGDHLYSVAYGNGVFLACRNTTGYYTSGP